MTSSRTPTAARPARPAPLRAPAPLPGWAARTRDAIRALPEGPQPRPNSPLPGGSPSAGGHLAWDLRAAAERSAHGSWRYSLGTLG
jgi:hypothetical protein